MRYIVIAICAVLLLALLVFLIYKYTASSSSSSSSPCPSCPGPSCLHDAMGWSDDAKSLMPSIMAQELGPGPISKCNGDSTKILKLSNCTSGIITSNVKYSDYINPNYRASPDVEKQIDIGMGSCLQSICPQ